MNNFYPRSPCGERPPPTERTLLLFWISIHALLAESDAHALSVTGSESQFLSTLSLRRATAALSGGTLSDVDFYPRSPCGERPGRHQKQDGIFGISIHALLAESDGIKGYHSKGLQNFYPRSPCGERPRIALMVGNPPAFLSTLSLRRAT